MYNVRDYGAKGDGKNLDSVYFQKAIDECSAHGGGTVFIPSGSYVCGTMHLHDNVHILFENGAKILGSTNFEDFEPIEELSCLEYQDRSHTYFHQSLFYAEGCTNISFSGTGTIDMRSVWQRDEHWREARGLKVPEYANPEYDYKMLLEKYEWLWTRGAKVIALKECNDVVISDLVIRNATDLAVYFAGCENVRVTGLNLRVHIDGISPDSCKNVIISDCTVIAGDDCVVPKSSYTLNRLKPCENIIISNCIMQSHCNAIKFGTESLAGFKNITITNCTIFDTYFSGIAVESVDGAVIDGLTVSNITMKNVGNPFMIIILHRGLAPVGTPIGKMRNITFSNITATGPYGEFDFVPHCFYAYDKNITKEAMPLCMPTFIAGQPDSVIENVTLSNINITMPGGGKACDRNIVPPEVRTGYPECTTFGNVLPVYGLFARHVNNLNLYNVNYYTYEEDARDAILTDRVTNYKNI